MKILVVEDEQRMSSFLKQGLEENGYDVEVAFDGFIGKHLAMTLPLDLLILDVNLPKVSGFEIVSAIRAEGNQIPVLMLTAMGSIENKTEGFEAGADDYLIKPFEFKELLLRVNALLKRGVSAPPQSKGALVYKDLKLDLNLKKAYRADHEIDLSVKEFLLLSYFIKNPGRVLSRTEIAEKVWDVHFETGTNIIDVYVNFLRKKIDHGFDEKLIQTAIGMGYIFR